MLLFLLKNRPLRINWIILALFIGTGLQSLQIGVEGTKCYECGNNFDCKTKYKETAQIKEDCDTCFMQVATSTARRMCLQYNNNPDVQHEVECSRQKFSQMCLSRTKADQELMEACVKAKKRGDEVAVADLKKGPEDTAKDPFGNIPGESVRQCYCTEDLCNGELPSGHSLDKYESGKRSNGAVLLFHNTFAALVVSLSLAVTNCQSISFFV